jgi:hypothetical protein
MMRRARVLLIGVVTLLALTVSGPPKGTYAWYTDSAAMDSGSIGAGTIPAPTLTCGALGVLSVTFDWTAVPGATSYTLHYGSGGSSTLDLAGTTTTLVAAIAGGTAWVVAHRDFGQTTWDSVDSNTRSYTVAVVSLCS